MGKCFWGGPVEDNALVPGIVANRYRIGLAKGALNAGHSLGRVLEREVATDVHLFSESINRWCTNVMLARSNARDCLQKRGVRSGDLMVSNSVIKPRAAGNGLVGARRRRG